MQRKHNIEKIKHHLLPPGPSSPGRPNKRDQQLLHKQLSEQNPDLREAHMKSLNEMEELKRFQGSTFDEMSIKRLIEDRDTILELTAKIPGLQNEVNCMNDSRDFKDAESARNGLSHVPSQPTLLPPYRDPWGLLSRSDKPPDIRDTHGISGNVFVNPTAPSSSPYPRRIQSVDFRYVGTHITACNE